MLWRKKMQGRVFINYRRSDAAGVAGRLADSLEIYFGDKRVFRDVESIEGGAEFGHVIGQNLHAADAMIVLIGPQWLTVTDVNGVRRLDDPDDWVRQEISVALQKVSLFSRAY
ncbi:MAG: toll/interleukin-1 receptor domain-containing protein [Lewinellaceae bacterium]|nr:toll/interleukin-1 receptor domain-containing protein [Lewinellaceae bacterium]